MRLFDLFFPQFCNLIYRGTDISKYSENRGMQWYELWGKCSTNHYENMPIQIYWKFYHQKMKIFR